MANSCNQSTPENPEKWNAGKLSEWVQSGKWKHGWNAIPDESINRRELAIQYFKNPGRWETAFTFLKNNALKTMNTGKYELEGEHLFVIINDYPTKDGQEILYEAHRKYADIQYMVYGEEKIGVVPLGNTREVIPYDPSKEALFASAEEDSYRIATPERFFIFFPDDAHKPGVNSGDKPMKVRKVVVKVKLED